MSQFPTDMSEEKWKETLLNIMRHYDKTGGKTGLLDVAVRTIKGCIDDLHRSIEIMREKGYENLPYMDSLSRMCERVPYNPEKTQPCFVVTNDEAEQRL